MEQTQIYVKNTFGLKTLDESGRLEKFVIDGVHLEFKQNHIQNIMVKALQKWLLWN